MCTLRTRVTTSPQISTPQAGLHCSTARLHCVSVFILNKQCASLGHHFSNTLITFASKHHHLLLWVFLTRPASTRLLPTPWPSVAGAPTSYPSEPCPPPQLPQLPLRWVPWGPVHLNSIVLTPGFSAVCSLPFASSSSGSHCS